MPAGFKLGLAAALILLIAVSAYFFAGGDGGQTEQINHQDPVDGGGYYEPGVSVSPADPALTTGFGPVDPADENGPGGDSGTTVDRASLSSVHTLDPGSRSTDARGEDTSAALRVDQFENTDQPPRGGEAAALQSIDAQDSGNLGKDSEPRHRDPAPDKSIEEQIAEARSILQRSGDMEKSGFHSGGRPDFSDGAGQPAAQIARRSASTRYTIRKGDSLWKIAERHYGDGNLYRVIVAANPGLREDRLQLGTTITLPPADRAAGPVSPRDASVARRAALPVNARLVTVRPGDSLYRIAERHYGDGTKWRSLYQANRDVLPAPDRLTVGMTLVLPGDRKFEK